MHTKCLRHNSFPYECVLTAILRAVHWTWALQHIQQNPDRLNNRGPNAREER